MKSECLTKTYNLLSLISFNLEELVTAEINDVKDVAKVIVNNFNTLVDILLQVRLFYLYLPSPLNLRDLFCTKSLK